MKHRHATIERSTAETDITLTVMLDGSGRSDVTTGIGFLDHMLNALARHASIDLTLRAEGDLEVDDHHTVEDIAIVLGQAIDAALEERKGIRRFGDAHVPLDEALCRAVIDFSGRGGAWVELGLNRPMLGTMACENVAHFFRSLASAARMTLHLDCLSGENDHHRVEAAFKAFAVAFRHAISVEGDQIPSTKGVLR